MAGAEEAESCRDVDRSTSRHRMSGQRQLALACRVCSGMEAMARRRMLSREHTSDAKRR
jgi:hypothetical protein